MHPTTCATTITSVVHGMGKSGDAVRAVDLQWVLAVLLCQWNMRHAARHMYRLHGLCMLYEGTVMSSGRRLALGCWQAPEMLLDRVMNLM